MTVLPILARPTTAVRRSYLDGELAGTVHRGSDATWLDEARQDFPRFVDDRLGGPTPTANSASGSLPDPTMTDNHRQWPAIADNGRNGLTGRQTDGDR